MSAPHSHVSPGAPWPPAEVRVARRGATATRAGTGQGRLGATALPEPSGHPPILSLLFSFLHWRAQEPNQGAPEGNSKLVPSRLVHFFFFELFDISRCFLISRIVGCFLVCSHPFFVCSSVLALTLRQPAQQPGRNPAAALRGPRDRAAGIATDSPDTGRTGSGQPEAGGKQGARARREPGTPVMPLSELSQGPFHPRASEWHLLHQISPSLHFYQFMSPPPILKSLASCSPLPAILLIHGTPNPNHCLRRPLSPEHSAWARGSLAY